MDGTLVDTEHLWLRAELLTMLRLGGEWTPADQQHCLGGPLERVVEYMAEKGDPNIVSELKEQGVGEFLIATIEGLLLAEKAAWQPGARDLVCEVVDRGIPTGLVTASWRRLIDAVHVSIAGDLGFEPFTVIVGGDEVSYGPPPKDGGKWKDIFLDEVKDRLDLSRVHFTGRVPYDQLVDLIHVSRVHAYLTYPFVLSWSMIETLAAGTLVVASDTKPVAEVIKDGVNGRLVGFFDIKGWSAALTDALARPEAYLAMRETARAMAREKYDLRSVCMPRQIDLLTRLERG